MKKKLGVVFTLICLVYLFIPLNFTTTSYSTLITDNEGHLLSAKIADDGQWRFPLLEDAIPIELQEATRYYEDEYFFWHLGVNPFSICRAVWKNLNQGKITSGGSTISMQVIRLLRGNRARTYTEKVIEVIQAFKLELIYSKEEILKLYFSHAPYGGNVVGAETAAWRYFNRSLNQLSWSEYATLAVLPNAPSVVRPGKNQIELKTKRNNLLHKLFQNGALDSITYSLAKMEGVPIQPQPITHKAFHLLDFAFKSNLKNKRVATTIHGQLQQALNLKLNQYVKTLSENQIRNACGLVISLENAEVIAYIGNTENKSSGAKYVDLIQAPRSSGSILKPFLYGKSLDIGLIHTSTILRDIPISIGEFSPLNFDKKFEGIVPAGEALAKSLNVPATLLLKDYGISPFCEDLKQFGLSTLNRSPENYGLTLILGGAEVTLWDIAKAYANQAAALNSYSDEKLNHSKLTLWKSENMFPFSKEKISKGSWWLISNALTNVQRPGLSQNWKRFSSSRKIAWKTGTSHGFRDAWAIGYDSKYLVAVWVGNAEGDGRPGLTGTSIAAPLMFQFFGHLNKPNWYQKPETFLKNVSLCEASGLSPLPYCPKKIVEMPINAEMPKACHYHQKILLDNKNKRVFRHCSSNSTRDTVWFSIDPIASHFYQKVNLDYQAIPELSDSCKTITSGSLDILYPQDLAVINLPIDLDRKKEKLLLEATHTQSNVKLFWHLNNTFIGTSLVNHKKTIELKKGEYSLLVLDENGNQKRVRFTIQE